MRKMLVSTVATLAFLATPTVTFAATSSKAPVQSKTTVSHTTKSTHSTKAAESKAFYKTAKTVISYNGSTVSKPTHLIATDTESKKSTSWLPLYDVNQVLEKSGVKTSWNAASHEWSITLPESWKTNLTHLPKKQPVNAGHIAIRFTNTNSVVEYAPCIEVSDVQSHVQTMYVPIYYVEQVLKRMGFQTSWNGTNWVIKR